MANPKLHLDADASIKALHRALLEAGFDVTRTPTDWMPRDASDKIQLLGATAQQRSIFTFNIRDFMPLARQFSQHHGIILAAQSSWTLAGLIDALTRLLTETDASDWPGQARWLNDWRE
jgi:hypothetical protein